MGINTVIRCSECDKIWRRAETKKGICPLCREIKRLKGMIDRALTVRNKFINDDEDNDAIGCICEMIEILEGKR